MYFVVTKLLTPFPSEHADIIYGLKTFYILLKMIGDLEVILYSNFSLEKRLN